jgi:uncharacterized protein
MAVSDTPWSNFSQSDYSPKQWAAASLIDTEEGAPDSKERYKLPVKEPSGAINRAAVHAATARLGQVTGVSADKKAEAARKLLSMYRDDLGEDAPESLNQYGAGGDDSGQRSAPPLERLFVANFIKGGSPIEVRSANGQPSRVIGGYAAVFGRSSENLGGFIEKVNPQAFNKSRADNWPGVVARFNHQDNFLLGSTRSGTLKLTIDNVGLGYEVDLPECRSDVLEMTQRGDLAHSSFAFQTYEDDWGTTEGGYPVRNLMSARLIDVAPVTVPAYPDATVGLRSLARHVGAPMEDVTKLAERDELRSLLVRTDNEGSPTAKRKPPKSALQARMEILARRDVDPIGNL